MEFLVKVHGVGLQLKIQLWIDFTLPYTYKLMFKLYKSYNTKHIFFITTGIATHALRVVKCGFFLFVLLILSIPRL
jgi:hypothetical protein